MSVAPQDEHQAAVGSAFARCEEHTWHIGNDHIALRLVADPGAALRPLRLELAEGNQWDLAPDGPGFGVFLGRQDLTEALSVTSSQAWTEDGAVRLAIEQHAKDSTRVFLHVECREGQGLLRQWLEIIPETSTTVERVEPIRLALARGVISTMHSVSGVQRQGGWRADQGPYRSFRLESTALDEPIRHHSGLRSSWDETPWTALSGTDSPRGGVIMALEYGGRWELCATPTSTSVVTAFAPDGIVPEVVAGERWVSPAAWIGAYPDDLDSAAGVMHRFMRETVVPSAGATFPWVQYNTWFSYYCNLDEETLLAEADLAADLGVEVFYVDAGWWVGNPRRRDRFSSGLGNWVENREKFPRGLRAFADAIRERGMHFGIWVEPERVDLRTATTGTWKQEWIAREADSEYVRCDWPSDTETAWLCFGSPEAQAWAEDWIGALVEELGVRWLKWDSNYWGVCTSPNHGHGIGDGERAQLDGVYAVMDRLRARFPDLVIENCAGGATRLDFAISRHAHAAWLNDASEPAHRSRFHNAGASYLFPPAMLNAWITESEHENVNGQDLPDPVWRSVLRSRMLGAIGLSCQLVTWSETTRAIAREELARYKQEIRPLLQTGSFHHLLPQPVIPSRDLPTPDVWEAYQFSDADGSAHVVLGFRNVCPDATITVHPGVDPAESYVITTENGVTSRHAGKDLLEDGLMLTCPLLASTWVTIYHEEPGS